MKLTCLPFLAVSVSGCVSFGDKVLAEGADGTGGSTGTEYVVTTSGGTANFGGAANFGPLTQAQWDKISDESCLGWSVEAEQQPANIVFVVDTSGSMADRPPNGKDGPTKWEITKSALETAISTLPRMSSVGMLLWPNKMTIPNEFTTPYQETGSIDACVEISQMVPLAPLGASDSDQRKALMEALAAVVPQGGTPMADAYNYALDNNYADRPLPNARYAVLITDGQPTIQWGCMGTGEEKRPVDYQPVLDSISGAFAGQPQVKTFVIGSPGSEHQSLTGLDGRDWLSQAAQAGGTPLTPDCQNTGNPNYCHFDMSTTNDFAKDFTAALQHITGQILPCAYTIGGDVPNEQVIDTGLTNVVYEINGAKSLGEMMLIGTASAPSCPEGHGWYFDPDDATNRTVQLCPMTCDMIRQDSGAAVNVRGGCRNIRPIG